METILSAPAVLRSNSGLDGIVIKGKPVIDGNSVSFTDCVFEEIELPKSQSNHLASSIIGPSGWNDLKLTVENCVFGENENAYNAFELNSVLSDGSKITGNTFDNSVCTHNVINLYDVEDGATIDISGNHFAKSANAIRIGIKGAREDVVINIEDNIYDETDSDNDYAGLVLIQPYGKATTDMGGITININRTVNNSENEQLWYYYADKSDTQLEIEQRPKIYVNGELQKYADEIEEEEVEETVIPTVEVESPIPDEDIAE